MYSFSYFLVFSKIFLKVLKLFQLYRMVHIKDKIFRLNLGQSVTQENVSSIPPSLASEPCSAGCDHSLQSCSKGLCLAYWVPPFPHQDIFLPVVPLQFIVFMLLNTYIPFKLPMRKSIQVCNVSLFPDPVNTSILVM